MHYAAFFAKKTKVPLHLLMCAATVLDFEVVIGEILSDLLSQKSDFRGLSDEISAWELGNSGFPVQRERTNSGTCSSSISLRNGRRPKQS